MTHVWVYGGILLLTLLHSLVLIYAYSKSQNASATSSDENARQYVTENGIECPNCGVLNERGYRYCRQCVVELPGSVATLGDDAMPQSRRTM
jgi:hypothetical protein